MSERTTYVLLPGAGGEAWYWHLVAPRLRALGHEVVAVDLPATDPAAGLAEYADTVVRAVGESDGVVQVAQSMAAFTAPVVSQSVPTELIVLLCPMIPVPAESPGAWWSNTGQEEARRALDLREGRDPDAGFDPVATFLHDLPAPVLEAAMARGGPRQADTPFGDPWPLDAWPDVPTRVLAGRHDRLFPLELVRRLARERLGLDTDVIDSGHLPALARPDELVQWLERYRAELVGLMPPAPA